jgi:hypothetical protein
VIGPGGEAASRVRRKAKCQLHVRRAVIAGDMQIVELKGNEAQVSSGGTKQQVLEAREGACISPSSVLESCNLSQHVSA